MCPDHLNLALLLSLSACLSAGMSLTEETLQIWSQSGSDCALPCTARLKQGVDYRAVRWYKVSEPSSELNGLLTRDLPNGTTRYYSDVDREVNLLSESSSIFLPNVTCADSGVYICHLAAPVGEQNREGQVLLTLTDCVASPTEELMTDTYLVIFASAVLMVALLIFLISYSSLKNILRDRSKPSPSKIEALPDTPFDPPGKKDLLLIATLGSKTSTMKHVCV